MDVQNEPMGHTQEPLADAARTEGKIRRIYVDRDACIAARSCAIVAPGVFQMDEEDLAYIVDPNAADDDTLMMAAQSCPVLAIHLYDEDGKRIFPTEDTPDPLA